MKKSRIIYNKRYFRTQQMLRNPDFLEAITDLKNEFAKWGCPIPKGGFKNDKGFQAWRSRLSARYKEERLGKKYNDALRAITGGAEKMTRDQFKFVQELEELALPPIDYLERIDTITEEFGLNSKVDEDTDWVKSFIFYNRTDYQTVLAELKFITPNKGKGPELWVQYFAHTKPSDIPPAAIKDLQKLLPEYREKNRPPEFRTLERDAEVIRAYYKIIGPTKEAGIRRKAGDSAAAAVVRLLKRKYPELTVELVQKIISRS
jgi:hypothetical protein